MQLSSTNRVLSVFGYFMIKESSNTKNNFTVYFDNFTYYITKTSTSLPKLNLNVYPYIHTVFMNFNDVAFCAVSCVVVALIGPSHDDDDACFS